ncbi:MAG: hypothetical protein N3A63_06320, partial [Bacteroidetes bacterium]|nr:hypothetical protein [Bacteroidota bacterium]
RYNHQQTDEAPHKHTLDFDQSFGDPLRNVIFRLPPNTVQILENDKAIYVVHVLEVRTEPLQPFDVLRSKLYQLLEMLYASRAISEFERDQKRVLNEKALRWNNKGVLQLKQWYTVSEGDIQRFTLIIQHAIDTGKNFSVVQMPNGEVDLRRFLYLLTSVQPFRKPLHIHENDVRNYIVESLRKDIILRKARKLGLDKKLFSSKTDNYVLIDEIAKKYNEVCIEQKIPHPTDDLVRKFYSERKDSIYYQLARVNIYVAYAPDTSVIYEFKNRLSLGIPFEKIDKRVFVKRYVRERNGTIRSEKPDDPVELGVVGFQLSLNEIAGPLRCNDPRNGEVYALIKCVYKEEEKQLMYDDIKEKVYEDYRSYYRELIEKRTLEQLRSKYKVRLYYERLEAALMVLGMPR